MSDSRNNLTLADVQPTVCNHPTGLYTLFFAEMWERFSYYGMRALLVFYMLKGFLQYNDAKAYAIYGAYGALVYMTPFFGGMLADKLLGARRAVIFGGLLMASGQACLMWPNELAFFSGLALLIVGNGFFKPNISNIVGTLYGKIPEKRDGGFTIFYMGINLGAAMSPLLCGYIGERFDWKYGFLLATIGMLTGLAVFIFPRIVTAVVIVVGALVAAVGLVVFHPVEIISTGVNIFVALALVIAASIAAVALGRGGLPVDAGAPPDPERLKKRLGGVLPAEWAVYIGTILVVPLFMIFVSGGCLIQSEGNPIILVPEDTIHSLKTSESTLDQIGGVCLEQVSQPVGVVLAVCFLLAFGYLIFETFRLPTVPRHHMYVVLILMFFCMMFWAFFEQAGSSINNFTDRNVDRVFNVEYTIAKDDVGKTIKLQPTQEQLGYLNGDKMYTMTDLEKFRQAQKENQEKLENLKLELDLESISPADKEAKQAEIERLEKAVEVETIPWQVVESNVGMNVASRADEIPASLFQSVNPIYILIFGLLFTALWGFLGKRGWEPSTPTKFALGLLQLGLGFAALWLGTESANDRGMVAIYWLLLCYLLHTTGELCLSPVGLSMISKLSPARLVSTVMGAWFLVTGISMFLAGLIAQFTGVESEGGEAAEQVIPAPNLTVDTYGRVYGVIAIAAVVCALICFCLVPLLKKWMHEGEETTAA